jgi:predicted acyltransferase
VADWAGLPQTLRLRSVDVFRGLTMAGMVIVNNPGDWGSVYAPLRHAEWHGWTPTDLIFPWFLVIMGTAMALAGPDRAPWLVVVRRTALIGGLGLFMAGFPYFDPARWRIPGVLMRIALCYLGAMVVWRLLARPADAAMSMRRLAAAVLVILGGYWALLTMVTPPGGLAGDLTPAGNLGAWLDRRVLGVHLYRPDWDPEALLGTLPAMASTLLGVLAGLWMQRRRPHSAATPLAVAGLVLTVAGLGWGTVFPINKSLWTSSYVLFTAGTGAIVLGVLHRRLDDGRASPTAARLAEPFIVLGRNALLLFVVSGLVGRSMIAMTWPDGTGQRMPLQQAIYRTVFAPLAPPKLASLMFALTMLALLYALLAWLHRRRWYWTA